jgi:hypothetical protein
VQISKSLFSPFFSCRKRHSSETLSDSSGDDYNSGMWSSGSDERSATPIMSECTAAMVLMNLSFSPGRYNPPPPATPKQLSKHKKLSLHNRQQSEVAAAMAVATMAMTAAAAPATGRDKNIYLRNRKHALCGGGFRTGSAVNELDLKGQLD